MLMWLEVSDTPTEQHDPQYQPNIPSGSREATFEHSFHSLFNGGEFDLAQFSISELFNPSFEEFSLSAA